MYDWANSAYYTVIVTAVFPVYFNKVLGADLAEGVATRRYGLITSLSMVVVALIAPVAGAIADARGVRKRLFAGFLLLGVLATACMFTLGQGEWPLACALLLLGNVGVVGTIVCYDGLLTHVARPGEMDRLSTTGYGFGYLGGGLLLGLNLAWIVRPQWFGLSTEDATLPVRLAFLSVAVWWAVFSIPLLLHVKEPPSTASRETVTEGGVVRSAFLALGESLRELKTYREAFVLLLAALFIGEGIGTIFRLAGAVAVDFNIDQSAILGALLLTQFVSIPFAVLFGWIAGRVGARRSIYIAVVVYSAVCIYAYFLKTERDFYVLALAVGTVQGGAQALIRSLFASLIPKHKATEFFGFFAFASKLAGSVGPASFFVIGSLTGSNRLSILSVIVFFVVGGLILRRVDLDAGHAAARAAEQRHAQST